VPGGSPPEVTEAMHRRHRAVAVSPSALAAVVRRTTGQETGAIVRAVGHRAVAGVWAHLCPTSSLITCSLAMICGCVG
jgi:hypothetical protein